MTTKKTMRRGAMFPEMVNGDEAAKLLHISKATLERWRKLGTGPPFMRFPGNRGRVLYRVAHLMEWLNAQETFPEK
jgi:DNA-binding transcriptional MerR regulator